MNKALLSLPVAALLGLGFLVSPNAGKSAAKTENATPSQEGKPGRTTQESFNKDAVPYFREFCLGCHSAEKHEGEFDLEELLDLSKTQKKSRHWRKIAEMIDTNEMPPKDAKQPAPEQKKEFRVWLKNFLDEQARARAGDPGKVVLRRLNNAEYTYTIADLTGVALEPAKEFPGDSAAGEGFTNTGNALVMSPALLTKYLDAAKGIAAHAVFLPDGLRFSTSTTRRDWTNEVLDKIRGIYRTHTEAQGASQVNLQGLVFDTNSGGRLPIGKFLTATIQERDALESGKKTPAQVAQENHLNAKYMQSLWKLLHANDDSPLLGAIRNRWKSAKIGDVDKIVAEITQWQTALTKFQSVGHMKPWMVSIDPIVSRQDFRVKLTAAPEAREIVVHLAASDCGDGSDNDFVVWERPRLVVPGRPELLLKDLPELALNLNERRNQLFAISAKALDAAAELGGKGATTQDLERLAKKEGIERELLESWLAYLGIGPSTAIKVNHFPNKQLKSGGYDFVNGWGLPELPNIVANSSGQHVRIPGNLKGHGVCVHPSPTLYAAAGWQSPIDGSFSAQAQLTHAHPECGNGVTWSLELRRGGTRQRLATGIAHGSTPVKVGPIDNIAIQKGDLVSLLVGPRDGNHSCDLTDIELVLKSKGPEAKEWSLTKDVSPDILAHNPHADRFGNAGIWHFYSEAVTPGGDSGSVIPAGSVLAKWQSETDGNKKKALARQFQDLLIKGATGAVAPPDKQLYQQLSSLGGPLFAQFKPSSASARDAAVVSPFGLPAAAFGKHPDGTPVDAASLCVKAPQAFEIRLPADLVNGAELVTTGYLHPATGGEGSVQLNVGLGQGPKFTSMNPGQPIVMKNQSEARKKLEKNLADFRTSFPAALCYPKIVPVDEVVTLTLFHREDDNLCRLMLDETQKKELDRLWTELHFISQDALTLVDAYNQLMEYATQDSDPRQFEPFRKPIKDRAANYRKELVAAEPAQLEAVLAWAAKAYRHPLTAHERSDLTGLYQSLRSKEIPHDEAIRLTLAKVLVSPAFLYKLEQSGPGSTQNPVSPQELASRLSYFLWSSLPDAKLRTAADQGAFAQADQVKEQAHRMLKDPKVRRLATEFACQWVHVYGLDRLDEKSDKHFPTFLKLRSDMYEEAILFFTDMVREDRSVLSVLDSDSTFLNENLARHYGIPGVTGPQWRKVDGLRALGRGGILGMAATLAKQSGASRTSPILRGNWISEVMLGEKLPRPPKDVPQLPEDEAATQGLTVRQLTEKHTTDPKCAFCHVRIDQFGFSLEGFDAIGRKRTKDLANRPIDTHAKLRDGKEFDGLEGLRNYLVTDRKNDFLRQFSKKLLGYALGRETQLSDEPILAEMRTQLEKNGYRFSAALDVVLQSRPFLDIRANDFPEEN